MKYCKETKVLRNKCKIFLIILLGLSINCGVYFTGGTHTAFAQMNFIPIFLIAYYCGMLCAVSMAVSLGLIVGPLMPIDVANNVMQSTHNWSFRIFIYIVFALIVGYVFDTLKLLNWKIQEKDKIGLSSGLYNQNKLLPILDGLIEKNEDFYLIVIKFVNFEQIVKYINFDLVDKLKIIIIDKIKSIFSESELYDIHSNEFALIYMVNDQDKIQSKTDLLFKKNFLLASIEHYVFTLVLKVGIYKVDQSENDSRSIYNKARVAIDQSNDYNSGIYYYNESIYNNQKLYFEVASSLRDSLRNEEFYLVYQPVVSFKDNLVIGCEVLTRWDRGDKTPVGPAMFIEVAEKIGCISDFSIWIISETIKQNLKWQQKDISIRIAVNVTAKEIVDKEFAKVIKEKIETNEIDRSLLSIEITERVLADEIEGLKEALEGLRTKGYKISIDDFGTGYNSLKFIGDIPFDVLKIDKYFIDHINKFETINLVSSIIKAAHNMGKQVVAEGIEEEYQVSILKELGCDFAQGYYFSKPLKPENFEEFYRKYNDVV